jgi:hypothetical protein
VWTQDAAAVFAAQVWWTASALAGEGHTWRQIPTGAVIVVVGYIWLGELIWLSSLVGLSDGALLRPVGVLLTLLCASLAAWVASRRPDPVAAPVAWSALRRVVAAGAVSACAWPALRPGREIGTAEFVLPSVDIIHNMSRAAIVQDRGYIPYGLASPASALDGDYYPRGFHLVAASLLRLVGVDPRVDTELWALDFARTFWLMWALVLVALAAWAVRLQDWRTGARGAPLVFVAATAPAVALLQPMFRGIVLPGFPAFALATLATIVALMHLSTERKLPRALLVTTTAAVVIAHAWPTLLLVVALAAIGRLVGERRIAQSLVMSWSALATAVISLLLVLRPLSATILSGDAANQAREPGSIAVVPSIVLAAWVIGAVLWLVSPAGTLHRAVVAPAMFGAALLELVALTATDWEWKLYYPKKVVWASVLIFLPPLAVAAQHFASVVTDRISRRAPWLHAQVVVVALVLLAVIATTRGVSRALLTNQPLLEARVAALAHQSLNRSDVQVVAQRYMTPESDYAVNRWGHAGLELRGVPALNLSDIVIGDVPREELCNTAGLNRRLLIYTLEDPNSPTKCGRVAP